MNDEWILVAGATSASLYCAGKLGLVPLRTFLAPAGGTSNGTLRQRHLAFAATLAGFLESGLASGDCRRITLAAACPFLGALRRALTPAGRRAAAVIVDEDLRDLETDGLAITIRERGRTIG